ncbi:hypothetical protein LSAT2_015402 [Lamellibrachia satsuma]|nr:hypothetical protein LSAT2_015402 [Lamellibrachia satsuma]
MALHIAKSSTTAPKTGDCLSPARPGMGNCCFAPSCLFSEQERLTVHTPLLKGKRQPNDVIIEQPMYSSVKANEATGPRRVCFKPVKVAHVDKQLLDHGTLYNDHVQRHVSLREAVRELSEIFPESRGNHETTLVNVFERINNLCGESKAVLEVRRTQTYCLHIKYDVERVPASVLPALVAFNRVNKLVRELLDKAPPLVMSAELLIRDEKELRRDVLAANLATEGPACMQNCLNNIDELRRVPGWVRDITTDTVHTFELLKKVARVLDGADDD